MPVKQPWMIWVNTSQNSSRADNITTTKQNTEKFSYLMGYIRYVKTHWAGWRMYAPVCFVIIGLGNVLSPIRRQSITWSNADMLSLQWNLNQNTNRMYLKASTILIKLPWVNTGILPLLHFWSVPVRTLVRTNALCFSDGAVCYQLLSKPLWYMRVTPMVLPAGQLMDHNYRYNTLQ